MDTITKTLDYFNKRMVLRNQIAKINSQKSEITKQLRKFFTLDKIIDCKYLFNRPNKWGNLQSINSKIVSSNSFSTNGKNVISSYYSHIELLTKTQILQELNNFQDVKELEINNLANFSSFFNESYVYLYLYAYATDEYEEEEESFSLYEYMIIQLDKKNLNIV